MGSILADRVFTADDQTAFAALTGDWNPMHVDAAIARRIGAGAQVVHGVHNLLWCLDAAARAVPGAPLVTSLRVNFDSFVTVGDTVEAELVSSDATRLRLEVRTRGLVAMTVLAGFEPKAASAAPEKPAKMVEPDRAMDMTLADLAGLQGTLGFARAPAEFADRFPQAARLLGARRLAGLGAFTRLVGMVSPGLHSIFNRIALQACADDEADDIGFRVTDVHAGHRRIASAVWGGGWTGTLTTTMRHPPAAQPSMAELARLIGPAESRHSVALVVGGSRGIGEVAAKLIAAGGGTPVITYASGQDDALRVAGDIAAWGGACRVMRLDVTAPIAEQLGDLADAPNELYYFATPMIGGRKTQLFEPARLADFSRFYIAGFYDCCQALLGRRRGVTAFYPSSVFVGERPAGVTEYAMAKAAGEALCRDMNDHVPQFRAIVSRLPRLATDQNPGLSGDGGAPSIADAMLPPIREISAISASPATP